VCKELDDELEAGKAAAIAVVEHLGRMGNAQMAKIPVSFVDGYGNLEEWEVSAKLISCLKM